MLAPQMLDQTVHVLTYTVQIPVRVAKHTGKLALPIVTLDHKARIHPVVPLLRLVALLLRWDVRAEDPDIAGVDGNNQVTGRAAVRSSRLEGRMQREAVFLEILGVAAEERRLWCWEGFHL